MIGFGSAVDVSGISSISDRLRAEAILRALLRRLAQQQAQQAPAAAPALSALAGVGAGPLDQRAAVMALLTRAGGALQQ